MRHENDDDRRLGEDAAHRLLARAVELDAARDAERLASLSVAQLRDVARDAGISAAAFEAALGELRRGADAPRPAPAARWRALGDAVARNALALVGGWAVISVASGVTNAAGAGWQGHQAAVGAANALAVLLAHRLRGRAVAVVLAVLAAAQLGDYALHLLYGAALGEQGKWALIVASLLGIGFGALLSRGRRAGGRASPSPLPEAAVAPAPERERPPFGSLRLRHA
jgi:hypothetical protein